VVTTEIANQHSLRCSGPTPRSSQESDLRGFELPLEFAVQMTTNAHRESYEERPQFPLPERLDCHGAADCRHTTINAKITIATIPTIRVTPDSKTTAPLTAMNKQEGMNTVIQPSGPCFVPFRVYPPKQNIGSPDQQKHVVESQACAEFPANLLFGLSRCTLNRIRVASSDACREMRPSHEPSLRYCRLPSSDAADFSTFGPGIPPAAGQRRLCVADQ
jgi:hypothetical protein